MTDAKLYTVKQLIIAHVAAMTVNGADVFCKDGWSDNVSGDPDVNVSWPPGNPLLWTGGGMQRNDEYFPTFWIRSRNENNALLCQEQLAVLWVPGSANQSALTAAGCNYMIPHKLYPSNTQGGTLEEITVGISFHVKLRYT